MAFIVRDYDEAIAWFTGVLGFALVEDTPLERAKRWVLVAPPGAGDNATILLARAPRRSRRPPSATRPAGASSCFCAPTISGATTTPSAPRASASSALPPRNCTEE
jgi:catechol 2,3-dioxygenase-like lactoylglutathione lyase family enzyme